MNMNIILFCMLIKQIERRVLILRVFISHASKNKEIVATSPIDFPAL